MRARTVVFVAGIAVLLLAWRCITAPASPAGPIPVRAGDIVVGVRPVLPPLKSTPSPFLTTPSEGSTGTATPVPPAGTPSPEP